jgi:hypothetical protein
MLKNAAAILISAALMFSAPAFAVDGQVLINQSTVMAAGGFPYKITHPGSYKLSGNLVVPADVDGIDILTDNVKIDLNGFTISGPGTCTGSGATISCVYVTSGGGIFGGYNPGGLGFPADNITIRNGSIVGSSFGIFLSGHYNLIEDMHVSGHYNSAIVASDAVIRRNTTSLNQGSGISGLHSTVTENVSNSNGQYGLTMVQGVYGSNTFDGNGLNPVVGSSVSQNNNGCNGVAC